MMNKEYEMILQKIADSGKQNRELFKKLKQMKEVTLTKLFNELHTHFFCQFNCLDCANCCKTLSPLLTNRDIDRLSHHLKMKRGSFIRNYITMDEDEEYIFKSLPCPFLSANNYCQIYDERPKACRGYPHTDDKMMPELVNRTKENAKICPSVGAIITELKNRL